MRFLTSDLSGDFLPVLPWCYREREGGAASGGSEGGKKTARNAFTSRAALVQVGSSGGITVRIDRRASPLSKVNLKAWQQAPAVGATE